jgi:hypothetical protein
MELRWRRLTQLSRKSGLLALSLIILFAGVGFDYDDRELEMEWL